MRSLRPVLAIALVTLGVCIPSVARARLSMLTRVWGDVIVSTDMSEVGKTITPPTTENPVYYVGQSLGCKFGSTVGDRVPDVKKMNLYVAEVLAKQGYLYAQPGRHDPTLFLVLQWGYLEPQRDDLIWFLGYDSRQDIAAPTAINMLGMEVFRRDFRSREIETILGNIGEPNYGVIITAFEFKSASTSKPIVYWQTRISLPAVAKTMAQALPTMVAAAGPAIGRESRSPSLMDADDLPDAHVELGELKIIGYEEVPKTDSPDPKK